MSENGERSYGKNTLCVWYQSSTNKETMKTEMPVECQKKGCDGLDKTCELYQTMEEAQK